jgi:nucleotide-binding universal stress UspA family protein
MITRILTAVDDSPAALTGARAAIELAGRLGARVRAVNVLRDGALGDTLVAVSGDPGVGERRGVAAASVLDHVARLAQRSGVDLETCQLRGEPARRILAEAATWHADLVVVGRSNQQRRAGAPYVGGETAHVLEFAEQPVLVVPPSGLVTDA